MDDVYFEPQSGGLCRKHAVNMAIANLCKTTKCSIVASESHLRDLAHAMGKRYKVDNDRLLTDFDAVMTDGSTLPSWCIEQLAPSLCLINVPKRLYIDDEASRTILSKLFKYASGSLVYNGGHIWTIIRQPTSGGWLELDSLRRPNRVDDIERYIRRHPNRDHGYIVLFKSVSFVRRFLQEQLAKCIKHGPVLDTHVFEVVVNRPFEVISTEVDRNFVLARWGDTAFWIAQTLRLGFKNGGPVVQSRFDRISKQIVLRYPVILALNDADFDQFTDQLLHTLIIGLTTDDDT